jgi:hypothetical protein
MKGRTSHHAKHHGGHTKDLSIEHGAHSTGHHYHADHIKKKGHHKHAEHMEHMGHAHGGPAHHRLDRAGRKHRRGGGSCSK